jgi:hypothetical protein
MCERFKQTCAKGLTFLKYVGTSVLIALLSAGCKGFIWKFGQDIFWKTVTLVD